MLPSIETKGGGGKRNHQQKLILKQYSVCFGNMSFIPNPDLEQLTSSQLLLTHNFICFHTYYLVIFSKKNYHCLLTKCTFDQLVALSVLQYKHEFFTRKQTFFTLVAQIFCNEKICAFYSIYTSMLVLAILSTLLLARCFSLPLLY